MKPFEVQPWLDVGGVVGLSPRSDVPIEKRVADALIRLGSLPLLRVGSGDDVESGTGSLRRRES